jgi:hypothetical protein
MRLFGRKRMAGGKEMKLRAKKEWDFLSYKGWAVFMGIHEEGVIVWTNGDKDYGNRPKGYYLVFYMTNEHTGPHRTFKDALAEMHRLIEKEVQKCST